MNVIVLYVTASTEAEARTIATTVVSERLAACANILPAIRSVYWWQGAIEETSEAAMLLKTRADLAEALTERIRSLHSYDCPCIVGLPVTTGNAAFLEWIRSETAG